ncbi:hypothetical protein AB0M80_43920 [Amycolatopsis sp. NPDC051045]|uniref:hypothetical protein n=1 Tax=Amycolatopsis sp. NPDC051045 TaxID=3156922 RepID=UPI00343B9EC3
MQNVDDKLPDDKLLWKVPLLLLRAVTAVTFRLAVTGRVPVLSGQYRWFTRQPHLAPEMSGSFPRFARRLTDGEWQKKAPEYVSRLLVNAFLEDLRRAYRLRSWQFWRRRRMTYPVLMLDGVTTGNGGYRVLELINAVRNQVGLFDPLLVLSASEAAPPDATPRKGRPKYRAKHSGEAYLAWQNELRDDRRARRDTARYLPIGIDDPESEAVLEESRRQRDALGDAYQLTSRQGRAPWWATRWTRIGVPLLVIALATTAVVGRHRSTLADHCGTDSEWLISTGSQCVGMTDGSFDLFQPSDDTTRQVEKVILEQNHQAETLHAAHPERPFITLVALEALTSSSGTVDGLTTERESLEGFAVAQRRQLSAPAASDPIVRILIANAGRGMREGVRVAKQLRELAEQDRSIVGVVGLDLSSEPTRQTIQALTDAGIPMVASTLSANRLTDQNPMYFQVTPQNRCEAAVAAAFAGTLPGRRRRVRLLRGPRRTGLRPVRQWRGAVCGPGGDPRRRRCHAVRGRSGGTAAEPRVALLLPVVRDRAGDGAEGGGPGLLFGTGPDVPLRADGAGTFAGRTRGVGLRRGPGDDHGDGVPARNSGEHPGDARRDLAGDHGHPHVGAGRAADEQVHRRRHRDDRLRRRHRPERSRGKAGRGAAGRGRGSRWADPGLLRGGHRADRGSLVPARWLTSSRDRTWPVPLRLQSRSSASRPHTDTATMETASSAMLPTMSRT